jgi:hypothetical protein
MKEPELIRPRSGSLSAPRRNERGAPTALGAGVQSRAAWAGTTMTKLPLQGPRYELLCTKWRSDPS